MTHVEPRRHACIAIIPARGGSKRIPKKNIRTFAGRPMIDHAIELTRSSGLFDRIIVSTDSPEIAAIAEQAGAEVPFMRPAPLADDHATTAAVLWHALEAIGSRGTFDFACCLYPATPFTTAADLRAGFDLVAGTGAASAFAVTRYAAPIWRAFKRQPNGRLTMLWPEHRDTRSQDLPEAFHDAGQFYWVPVPGFLDQPALLTDNSRGVVYEGWRAHDIDTEDDWMRAELIFRALYGKTAA
jgi:pseudaminic acid cytidylyltransferase